MNSSFLSDKIKILSFIAILFVLYIHSGFHDYPHEIQGMPMNFMLQDIVSGMIAGNAVPLFFCISGFLFFRDVDSIKVVYRKQKKRIHTLLIPFVIAACFFPLFQIAVEHIPFAAKFSNGAGTLQMIKDARLIENLLHLFWGGADGSPMWTFQLWFLRDLLIIVSCTPLLFFVFRTLRNRLVWAILSLAIIATIPVVLSIYGNIRNIWTSLIMSFCWFMCGALFLKHFSRVGWVLPLLIYVMYCIAKSIGFVSNEWEALMHIFGVLAIWNVYDQIIPFKFELKNHHWFAFLCSCSFFIYLYHEPTINIVRKLLVLIFGHSSVGFAASYLFSPWIFVLCATVISWGMRQLCPKFYLVLTGGRA